MSGQQRTILLMMLPLLMIALTVAAYSLGRRHANDCMRWNPQSANGAFSGGVSTAPSACRPDTGENCPRKLPNDSELKAWLEDPTQTNQ